MQACVVIVTALICANATTIDTFDAVAAVAATITAEQQHRARDSNREGSPLNRLQIAQKGTSRQKLPFEAFPVDCPLVCGGSRSVMCGSKRLWRTAWGGLRQR